MTFTTPLRLLAVSCLALSSLALSTSASGTAPERRQCGNEVSDDQVKADEAHFQSLLAAAGQSPKANTAAAATIPVYFHVIQSGSDISQGNIPDYQIKNQMEVLNQDFARTGLSFNLTSTDHTVNADWFQSAGNGNDSNMKGALRRGGPSALNIYSVSFQSGPSRGILGYATFPANYGSNPTVDGVVIRYDTVPGGNAPPFNLGKTLTHEVGHWVGLYHTFQGGCNNAAGGDQVSDTPLEAGPAFGCPVGRDSCPTPGVDPIHNFMDYGDDSCLNQFTDGQIQRLRQQLQAFRGVYL